MRADRIVAELEKAARISGYPRIELRELCECKHEDQRGADQPVSTTRFGNDNAGAYRNHR
jgi:hypothetical protein